jgi:hypothetical protein
LRCCHCVSFNPEPRCSESLMNRSCPAWANSVRRVFQTTLVGTRFLTLLIR